MWVGLFPELSDVGGIQQVSRHTAAVLAQRAQEREQKYELLGLNDRESGSFRVGQVEYRFRGFGRNKTRLLLHLLRALPDVDTLCLGHVNLAPPAMLLHWLRPRVQYSVFAHGVEVWDRLPLVRRVALQNARRVMAVSQFTARAAVVAQKLDPDRVCVVPPALDPSFLSPARDHSELALPPASRVLLTVGRLISTEPGKGVDAVIRVLPRVLDAVPDAFYVVIGAGDHSGPLAELAQASAARDRIVFGGQLEGDQLKNLYARCAAFVMPSRQEGFGLVFLEAMAMGKPVIAGKYGGAPEVVQDGITGFLVDLDDADDLAARLIQVLRDETLSHEMGEAGRRRVEQCYTFERFSERLREVLDATSAS